MIYFITAKYVERLSFFMITATTHVCMASGFVRVSCMLAAVSLLPVLHPLSSSVLALGVGIVTAVYLLALGLLSNSTMSYVRSCFFYSSVSLVPCVWEVEGIQYIYVFGDHPP